VKGFTLVETMVVVCIVGVMSLVVVLGVAPGEGAAAEKEARRLAALLELAAAEARASGEPLAWTPERRGYSFWRRAEDGEWLRFPDSSPYRQRSFAAGIAIEGAAATLRPHGLQAPLEASIRGGNTRILDRSGALGRVSLQRLHAD
jgi:general secretion pathway protein H